MAGPDSIFAKELNGDNPFLIGDLRVLGDLRGAPPVASNPWGHSILRSTDGIGIYARSQTAEAVRLRAEAEKQASLAEAKTNEAEANFLEGQKT